MRECLVGGVNEYLQSYRLQRVPAESEKRASHELPCGEIVSRQLRKARKNETSQSLFSHAYTVHQGDYRPGACGAVE